MTTAYISVHNESGTIPSMVLFPHSIVSLSMGVSEGVTVVHLADGSTFAVGEDRLQAAQDVVAAVDGKLGEWDLA